MDKEKERNFKNYVRAAVDGSGQWVHLCFGSTATTVVVFFPLGIMSGLAGQFFQPWA